MISGTRKDRASVAVQPQEQATAPAKVEPTTQKLLLAELRTIRSRVGWLLFIVASFAIGSILVALFR